MIRLPQHRGGAAPLSADGPPAPQAAAEYNLKLLDELEQEYIRCWQASDQNPADLKFLDGVLKCLQERQKLVEKLTKLPTQADLQVDVSLRLRTPPGGE